MASIVVTIGYRQFTDVPVFPGIPSIGRPLWMGGINAAETLAVEHISLEDRGYSAKPQPEPLEFYELTYRPLNLINPVKRLFAVPQRLTSRTF